MIANVHESLAMRLRMLRAAVPDLAATARKSTAMLSLLADYQDYFGPLRLLHYITVRTLLAAVTALLIGFLIAPRMIARFRELKFGHGYIDDRTGELGATYFDKKHTPTMGGLIIFLAVIVSSALCAIPNVWVAVS